MKIGLQLWTVRHEAARDFAESLRQVAAVGYRAVEFAGYGGWPADELKGLVTDLGLRPVSSHVGWERLRHHRDEELAYAQTLGLEYLVCPGLPEAVRQDPAAARAGLVEIAAGCRAAGLTFGYHNHAVELTERGPDGRPLLDALLGEPVAAELDLYWLAAGGADPQTSLARYAGQVPLVHLKDMAPDRRHDVEVGQGVLPWAALRAAAAAAQVAWGFVEQEDFTDSPWPRIAQSLAFLRATFGEEAIV
ncbi:MAG: sugar phosphate isomerase/epimerase [Firmicutes bacterium]|nr:sugar phosphate isomerase/epimerase [Bacillota bacterium]